MTESERAVVMAELAAGAGALLPLVTDLSPAQAAFRQTAESWSILEVLEHVAVAERGMLWLIRHGTREAGRQASEPAQDPRWLASAKNRARKFQAPDPARPSGRFSTLEQARQYFEESRRRTLEFVGQCPDDLRALFTVHPVAGPIDCHQCLLLLAAHPSRHAQQIREIRAHPEFPKL